MGQAKRRREIMEAVLSGSLPEQGLFFLFKKDGISAVLVARRVQRDEVQAALFCVDEWQDGLFQCRGRSYGTASLFQEDFGKVRALFRPARIETCARLVARGMEMSRRGGLPLPPDFSRWVTLLGELPVITPAESVFLCPLCESPLPPETVETILSHNSKEVTCYMVCEECIRLRRPGPTAETASIKHRHALEMFEDMETFSLDFGQRKDGLAMAPPEDVHRKAIVFGLEQDRDPVKTASFALESWIHRATVPNERVTDQHVILALEQIREARMKNRPFPEPVEPEVSFVRDAAQEGLAAFISVCADRLTADERNSAVSHAIDRVLDSARFHSDRNKPRAYIDFVSPFMK